MPSSRHLEPVLISACLLGKSVRYDGGHCHCTHPLLQLWQTQGRLISICPEIAGGLPTPRPRVEIEPTGNGNSVLRGQHRVLDQQGQDYSGPLQLGARQALKLAQQHGIRIAILKANSPSCGNLEIADGHFRDQRIPGQGVTASALLAVGIRVFNEHQLQAVAVCLEQLEQM